MYRIGFGDASGMTTTPAQGIPLATVSQYAIVECGFGQKQVDHGPNAPNTCAFDMATAVQQAWTAPAVILGTVPTLGNLPQNALSALAWGTVAWFFFLRGGGRGRY